MKRFCIKLTAFLACISLILSSAILPAAAFEPDFVFDSGSGSASDPYIIKTRRQFLSFAEAVNSGRSFEGEHINLGADIELNDVGTENWQLYAESFVPIGSCSDTPFKGVFDGKGFSIRGLFCDSSEGGGLFGFINGGEVKNLILLDSFMSSEGAAGGIAAVAVRGKITNCKSVASFSGINSGGIVGIAENTEISSSVNYGGVSGAENAGGIVGSVSLESKADKCLNLGAVYSPNNAGGIVSDNKGKVTNCKNAGAVSSDTNAGGIAANNLWEISASANHGSVSGNVRAGGISAVSSLSISDCYNAGSVWGGEYSAGIAALHGETSSTTNCYNAGEIRGEGQRGAISAVYKLFGFSNCYYLDISCLGGNAQGTPLSHAQMQNRTSFTGFNFLGAWRLNTSGEYKYPTLANTPDAVRVSSVAINKGEAELFLGESFVLNANALPENSTAKYIRFYSENPEIASVTQDGTVNAVNAGETRIFAESADGGFSVFCAVRVLPPKDTIEIIRLNKNELNLQIGDTEQLFCEIVSKRELNLIWTSDDSDIASVNESGLVKAISAGSAVIWVRTEDGTLSDSCLVTVTEPYVPVTGIELNKTYMELEQWEWDYLSATVLPTNANNKAFTWVSSNQSVAVAEPDGRVIGVAPGEADIFAVTDEGGFIASCKVKVKSFFQNVTDVIVEPSELYLSVGEERTLTVKILPEEAGNKNVYWISGNSAVVSVNQKGEIKALSIGTAVVTAVAEDGGITGSAVITVKAAPVPVSGVTLSKNSLELMIDENFQLYYEVLPHNADNKSVRFESSNALVATVSQSGLVTGKTAGTAVITVVTMDGGYTASCTVTVKPKPIKVTGVSLNKNAVILKTGKTETLFATVKPQNADNKKIIWTSSNNSVATVSQNGVVTALKSGTATIKAITEDGGYTASCTVVVEENVKLKLKADSGYKLDSKLGIVYNIRPNTKVSDLLKSFEAGKIEVKNSKGKLLSGSEIVPTGSKISLIGNDGVSDTLLLSVLGDVNGDGQAAAADARLVLRFVAKLDSPTEYQKLSADVNGKGISAADARAILRAAAKLDTL